MLYRYRTKNIKHKAGSSGSTLVVVATFSTRAYDENVPMNAQNGFGEYEKELIESIIEKESVTDAIRSSSSGLYIRKEYQKLGRYELVIDYNINWKLCVYVDEATATFWRLKYGKIVGKTSGPDTTY